MATVAELVKRKLGVEKVALSEEELKSGKSVVGDLKREDVVEIAREKMGDMGASSLKAAVKCVLGTLVSMRYVSVEGKPAKEALRDLEAGRWDDLLG